MQHTAVAQDDEALIEAVAEARWIGQDFFPPAVDDSVNLTAQRIRRHRIEQRREGRAGQNDPVFSKLPAHHQGVAVLGADQLPAAIVQVPELLAWRRGAAQDIFWEVGAFQVLRLGVIQVEEVGMHALERLNLGVGQFVMGDDDPVHVAVAIEIAHGE